METEKQIDIIYSFDALQNVEIYLFFSLFPQLPVADPFLEKVNLSDLGE